VSPSAVFEVEAAHKFFAADCFNKAWDLIDKEGRTPEEDEQMILLNQASIWHWTGRDDCKDTNLSVGYWQASRIYALLGQADSARRYGELSLKYSHDAEPFFAGYAYEALARAEKVAGDAAQMNGYLEQAKAQAEKVTDEQDRKLLEDDLATIA
jgi:hypothetical protein